MEYTFISYSRRQLYFAEAIVLHLQKEGIETWFDIQKLEPGADWESALKEGYENCQRLILVISQAALASEYVEKEWDTALQNGREVILAAVEDVDIPERLRDCTVIDFRTNFDIAMERLVSYLTGNLPRPKDPIQAPGKFPYPLRMPFPIWFMIFASMWPYVWMLVLSLIWLTFSWLGGDSNQGAAYTILLSSILIGGIAFTTGVDRFLKHNLDQHGVNNLVGFAFIFQMLLTLVALVIGGSIGGVFGLLIISTFIICFTLNLYFYRWFPNRSASLLRWYAAGQASQKLRRQCHGKLLGKDVQLAEETFKSEPVNFYLHNDPGDRPMAGYIVRMLSKAGHHAVEDVSKAQQHLYLISNRTSRKMVEEASKTEIDSNIFLLGSSIIWSESLESAGKTQFVDLRKLDANSVKVLANSLSYTDVWRRHYGLEAAPTKFEAFTVPTSVLVFRFLAYLQAAAYLSVGLFQLYAGPQILTPFLLLLGIGTYFLVERILQRKIPFLIVLGVLVGPPLLISVLLFTSYFIFRTQLELSMDNATAYVDNVALLVDNILIPLFDWASIVIVDIVVLIKSRFWFPSFAPYAKDALGMDIEARNKTRGRVFVVVFTIIMLAIRLLQLFSNS